MIAAKTFSVPGTVYFISQGSPPLFLPSQAQLSWTHDCSCTTSPPPPPPSFCIRWEEKSGIYYSIIARAVFLLKTSTSLYFKGYSL